MKNRITFFFAVALLVFAGLGCRNLFDKPREDEPLTPTIEANKQKKDNNQAEGAAGDTLDASPSATATPKTVDSNSNSNSNSKVISGGVLNGKATTLVKPAYPPAARAVRASGAVNVQVTIDEQGNVISANAVSGHPLLRASAVSAARQSKFAPTLLSGKPVKVSGIIVYNYVPE